MYNKLYLSHLEIQVSMLFCCNCYVCGVVQGQYTGYTLKRKEKNLRQQLNAVRRQLRQQRPRTSGMCVYCTCTASLTVLGSVVYSGKDNVCKISRKCEIIFSFKICLFDFTNITSPI